MLESTEGTTTEGVGTLVRTRSSFLLDGGRSRVHRMGRRREMHSIMQKWERSLLWKNKGFRKFISKMACRVGAGVGDEDGDGTCKGRGGRRRPCLPLQCCSDLSCAPAPNYHMEHPPHLRPTLSFLIEIDLPHYPLHVVTARLALPMTRFIGAMHPWVNPLPPARPKKPFPACLLPHSHTDHSSFPK